MSAYHLTKLAWDLEHVDGLLERFGEDPDAVLDGYRLTDDERRAVQQRDAAALLPTGINPVALRNLMVLLGVPHSRMYNRAHEDRAHEGGPR